VSKKRKRTSLNNLLFDGEGEEKEGEEEEKEVAITNVKKPRTTLNNNNVHQRKKHTKRCALNTYMNRSIRNFPT